MVTFYKNITKDENKHLEITDLLKLFNNEKLKELTEKVRVFDKHKDKENYRKVQMNLPVICASAEFQENKTHSLDFMTSHSNLIMLDYDELLNIEEVFNKLKENNYIHLMFRSSSGGGLKVIIKVSLDTITKQDADMSQKESNEAYNRSHKVYYELLGKELVNITGQLPDDNAKDITRCSYITYDSNVYYNKNSIIYKITPKEFEAHERKKLKQVRKQENRVLAVTSIEVNFMNEVIEYLIENKLDITDNYDDWIYLAFLCKKLYEPNVALVKFHLLSQFSPKYKAESTTKKLNDILRLENDKPTSFSYLDKILKDYGITFYPKKSKNLFNEKLSKLDVMRIIEYEKWEMRYCKIKKMTLIFIPNLNHPSYPNNTIPLEISGKKGLPIIWNYFRERYNIDLTENDIEKNIYSFKKITDFNFAEEKLNQIKTDDPSEYNRFFKLIESQENIQSGMTRWFIGCFDNWLKDYGLKYDEMLILHDDKGNIGKTDLINNYMFSIFKYGDLNYLTSNINFSSNQIYKDSIIEDFTHLVSYKPEISSNILKNSDLVKDYISRKVSSIRSPYARHNLNMISYTSFIGDTNDEQFLAAEINRRRFIVCKINKLNFIGANFNWEKFWGYLYYLYKDLNVRFNDYPAGSNIEYVEKDVDLALLDEICSKNDESALTSSEIMSLIRMHISSFRLSKNKLGKYLKMYGYEYEKRWVPSIRTHKTGWNISININNANEFKI